MSSWRPPPSSGSHHYGRFAPPPPPPPPNGTVNTHDANKQNQQEQSYSNGAGNSTRFVPPTPMPSTTASHNVLHSNSSIPPPPHMPGGSGVGVGGPPHPPPPRHPHPPPPFAGELPPPPGPPGHYPPPPGGHSMPPPRGGPPGAPSVGPPPPHPSHPPPPPHPTIASMTRSYPSPARSSQQLHPPPTTTAQSQSQPQQQQPQYIPRSKPKPKIDPAQIPRAPIFTRPQSQKDEPIPIYYPSRALSLDKVVPPPLADSRFLVEDDGNASPQLIRSTLYAIPKDSYFARRTGIDMGLLCTPLAIHSQDTIPRPIQMPTTTTTNDTSNNADIHHTLQDRNKDPQRISVLQINDNGVGIVPKCPVCHVYANPFWTATTCNFCRSSHRHVDIGGMPLQYGTVEYEVGGPYITRVTPAQPVHVYALDASLPQLELHIQLLQNVGIYMAQQYNYSMSASSQQQQQQQQYQRQSLSRNRQQPSQPTLLRPRIGCCIVAHTGLYMVYCKKANRNGGGDNNANAKGDDLELALTLMSDITDDPFCPLPPESWTCDMGTDSGVREYNQVMSKMYEMLKPLLTPKQPSSSKSNKVQPNPSAGGAALAILANVLEHTGGKATYITHTRPNRGIGSIRDREQKSLTIYTKSDRERELYTPIQLLQESSATHPDPSAAQFYTNLGNQCVKDRVSLNVYFVTRAQPSTFLDIATLSEVCRVTGGKLHWIRGNSRWPEQLQEELLRNALDVDSGSDAIFKVRCSEGIQVKSYMTASGITVDNVLGDSPEIELSNVGAQTCIGVELEHRVGGMPKAVNHAYFQSVLLYTTSTGKRRLRVSTMGLRASVDPAQIFRSADFSAVTAMLTRHAIAHVWKKRPEEEHGRVLEGARKDVGDRCEKILSNYRMYTSAKNSPPGQLILPETLQLLPLYCMCLLKSSMFRPSLPKRESGVRVNHPSPSGDERAYSLHHGAGIHPALSLLQVHPNIFSVSELKPNDGDVGEWHIPSFEDRPTTEMELAAHHPFIKMPRSIHPSITCLEEDGIYLIDDGLSIILCIGQNVSGEVKQELLEKDELGNVIVSPRTDYGQRVLRLVWQMRIFCSIGTGTESSTLRPTYPPIIAVFSGSEKQDTYYKELVLNAMVHDSTTDEDDYVEFLCGLHRKIRDTVSAKS